ncbi:hypothetical protein A2U01_0040085, partial [Trifolium medium]|nr:hypothetical protein [Trifolium medium]
MYPMVIQPFGRFCIGYWKHEAVCNLPLHSCKALYFKFSLAVMSSFTRVVSDAVSTSGPSDLPSIDSLVESMKALLKEDLDDLFLVPWMVDDFHEITRNLEKFCESLTPMQHGFLTQSKMFESVLLSDLQFIKSAGAANQKVCLALSDASN